MSICSTAFRRGHDVVLLTNVPDIAAGTRVTREIDLGPKLARRTRASGAHGAADSGGSCAP